jgi:hypothetical protein
MYYFIVVKSLMAFYDQTLATDAGFLKFVDVSIISMTCLFVIKHSSLVQYKHAMKNCQLIFNIVKQFHEMHWYKVWSGRL